MEKDDDPILSQVVKFDVRSVFDGFVITDFKETNLAANQLKTESNRLKFWKAEDKHQASDTSYEVTLGPMEIKTFVVKMTMKHEQK
jgi:hypothetical protein